MDNRTERIDLLNGFLKRVFIYTDLISYLVNVPVTVTIALQVLPLSSAQQIGFFLVTLVLVLAAVILNYFQLKAHLAPVLSYFTALANNESTSDEQYARAKKLFFNAPKKRATDAAIAWIVLMGINIAIFIAISRPGLFAFVVLIALFVINILSVACRYYIVLDYQTRRIAQTGIFGKTVEGSEIEPVKLGRMLSIVMISIILVLCTIMLPILYRIIDSSLRDSYVNQMANITALVDRRIESMYDSRAAADPDRPLRSNRALIDYSFVRDIVIGERGYLFVLDRDFSILAHPKQREGRPFTVDRDFKASVDAVPLRGLIEIRHKDDTALHYIIKNRKYGFISVATVFTADIEKPSFYAVVFMFIFLTIGFLITGGLILWYITFRLEPLDECVSIIEDIGNGNLSPRTFSISHDEVGMMIGILGRFTDKLYSVIKNIHSVANELASASVQMSATAGSFTENAQNQSATAEQATASAEQVSAGVESIADGAEEQFTGLNSLMGQIGALASGINETGARIKSTVQISAEIAEKAKSGDESLRGMNNAMNRITESSREMTSIVEIINDISDRINLLSLNAAIEAARAGDAGRGFAVVADEISKLADQTASSIKEIDRFIKSNNQEISIGMQNINATMQVMKSIIDGVSEISDSMMTLSDTMQKQLFISERVNGDAVKVRNRSEEIKIATDELKRAMIEIVRSITLMSDLTQSIASGSEQMASNSETVELMAESLKGTIDFFTV